MYPMKEFELDVHSGRCRIVVGESINKLGRYAAADKVLLVTDRRVAKLHGEKFSEYESVVLGEGERSKTLSSIRKVYEKALDMELDRNSYIIGVGGGIVCDMAGFSASTYLRGVRCGLVPTTILSQVDAAIGGKNGVNLKSYKNMVGTIKQPEFCMCDIDLLKTLSADDISCGMAEVIKDAAIADADFFSYLEGSMEKAINLDKDALYRIVCSCIGIKTGMVSRDEQECAERMLLNFGHTFGHAIEKTTGLPHGASISIGMMIEAGLSVRKGLLSRESYDRIEMLLMRANLPTTIGIDDAEALSDAIMKDKKRAGGEIHTVLLDGIGKARIERIDIDEIIGMASG